MGAFGVKVAEEDVRVEEGELAVVSCYGFIFIECEMLIVCLAVGYVCQDPDNLDFEAMLIKVIEKLTNGDMCQAQICPAADGKEAGANIIQLSKRIIYNMYH